jgi:TRAP transporter TAXI family solute receptor
VYRFHLPTRRIQVVIAALAVAVISAAALWTFAAYVRPMPPRTLTMVTGPEGGAYHNFGIRYREILARDGIKLKLQTTSGAIENLALLRDRNSGVEVGFLQSGLTSEKASPDLRSLGTLFYEPLWFFYRDKYRGNLIRNLRGKKISIGTKGSGTRELALKLFALNGMDGRYADMLALTPREAAEKLMRGEIDASIMITSWDAPAVQQLLTAKGIELASFPRTDAYLALYPFLSKIVLPQGVIDLAKNRPASDLLMFAPKANLIIKDELHPALQFLLLRAAEEIHSGPGMFQKAGQFPAAESIDLPLSGQARQYYRSGSPFLQQNLPFWMAVLIGRILILLIPLLGILYPLLRLLPAIYGWRIQRRIFRLYGELRFLEHDLDAHGTGRNFEDLKSRLQRIEEMANHMRVPLMYSNMRYTLWMHITLVRDRLEKYMETGKRDSGT